MNTVSQLHPHTLKEPGWEEFIPTTHMSGYPIHALCYTQLSVWTHTKQHGHDHSFVLRILVACVCSCVCVGLEEWLVILILQ